MEPDASRTFSLPLASSQLTAAMAVADVQPAVTAVYAHVPFCFHKCHYCDFYSFVDADDRQPAYVARLESEIDALAPLVDGQTIETVFVGGGTPTLLRPDLLRRALTALRDRLPLAADVEWTVEANPETVTEEIAAILTESGVNRTSVGAQSFHPQHLKTLERWHDPVNVGRAVARLRAAGIRRLNIDLIFGIPGSTLDDWQRDLASALALEPEHLSCYGLTYEPNTAMTKRLQLGQFIACDEDLEAAMYEHTLDTLGAAGFEQYEISNFAKPGEACRHNLKYWRNADWWALGPSASGHAQGVRWKNMPRITSWLNGEGASPVVDVERVDRPTQTGELLMLGLRLREGIDRATFDRCREGDRGVARVAVLDSGLARGLLEWHDDRLRFTRSGMLIADEVLAELV